MYHTPTQVIHYFIYIYIYTRKKQSINQSIYLSIFLCVCMYTHVISVLALHCTYRRATWVDDAKGTGTWLTDLSNVSDMNVLVYVNTNSIMYYVHLV